MTEIELMLSALLDCNYADLVGGNLTLTEDQEQQFKKMCARRVSGEPIQYICGFTDFCNVRLNVDPRVLIPRPETEFIVDYTLNLLKQRSQPKIYHILDCGTGSGNIPIYFAKNLDHVAIESVDVSSEALDCAKANAILNDVDAKINFQCLSMFEALERFKSQGRRFDLIISNPPYIKTDDLKTLPKDVQYEPLLALDGGDDGCDFYHGIFKHAFDCLTEAGMLVCEIGEKQGEPLVRLVKKVSSQLKVSLQKDLCGCDRFVVISH